jgi:hypothetical protein
LSNKGQSKNGTNHKPNQNGGVKVDGSSDNFVSGDPAFDYDEQYTST